MCVYIITVFCGCSLFCRLNVPSRDTRVVGYKARQKKKLVTELDKEYQEIIKDQSQSKAYHVNITYVSSAHTYVHTYVYRYVHTYVYLYCETLISATIGKVFDGLLEGLNFYCISEFILSNLLKISRFGGLKGLGWIIEVPCTE